MSVKFTSKGLADGTDSTKELEFNVAGVTTGTTRTITVPDENVDLGKMGKVLQVVSVSKSSTFSTSSTSFTDVTGFNVSITPSSTSSKVLVLMDADIGISGLTYRAYARLMRDATPISVGDASGSTIPSTAISGNSFASVSENVSVSHLDSPNTTSSVTYKLQVRMQSGGGTLTFNKEGNDSGSATNHRGASNITLMEIGA